MLNLKRFRYVWSWRLRYWYLDTPRGRQWHRVTALLQAAIGVALAIWQFDRPVATGEPVGAFWWFVALLFISVAVTIALSPKPESQKPRSAEAPQVEDGAGILEHFGTVWVTDSLIVGWRTMGTIAIKKKGGKK